MKRSSKHYMCSCCSRMTSNVKKHFHLLSKKNCWIYEQFYITIISLQFGKKIILIPNLLVNKHLVNGCVTQIEPFRDHSNRQPPISTYLDLGDIFSSWEPSPVRFIFNLVSAFRECLKPPENLVLGETFSPLKFFPSFSRIMPKSEAKPSRALLLEIVTHFQNTIKSRCTKKMPRFTA